MQAGKLTERITIQRPTGARDEWNTPRPQAWKDVASVWADIRHQSGSESIRAGVDVSIVRASIRIRWRTGIDASMRVLYQGQAFDIEAVLPGGNRQHIDLVCKLVSVADEPQPQAPAPDPEPDPGGGGWGGGWG